MDVIKLSAPASHEYWEIPVLYEDEHLLALDKPSHLLSSPDRYDPERPNLMRLLHQGIARGAPWAVKRGVSYLANAHRLDFETSGIMLLAKDKPTLVNLANQFGTEKPEKLYVALVQGNPPEEKFSVEAMLGPHPVRIGTARVDKNGKNARTEFGALERFVGYTLLQCRPLTGRTHQIRVHLQYARFPIVGDRQYGGRLLLLSRLKRNYRLKPGREEKPLLQRCALHAEKLTLCHPGTGQPVSIQAPWPKDLTVAVKYLRRFASGVAPTGSPASDHEADLSSQI